MGTPGARLGRLGLPWPFWTVFVLAAALSGGASASGPTSINCTPAAVRSALDSGGSYVLSCPFQTVIDATDSHGNLGITRKRRAAAG